MLFAVIAADKPGSLDLRRAERAAHLDYLRTSGVVKLAGPLLDDAGAMAGSLMVIEAADRAAAERWLADEPFHKAGLFARVELTPWRPTINHLDKAD